ncbi:PBAN-type neuropeptides-like [Cylas formicarius]|uniref:PBAN-type neuropeptides-like n=1 Tax=Cylas formicarius TaxID=197179 RepID=UPI002958D27E|nr:PBAN-type neuropeptides-like [Cylas formicarius]
MGYVTAVNCLLILTALCLAQATSNNYDHQDEVKKDPSDLWFGQRLGRRKRNGKMYRADQDQASGILDVLRESPLVVVAVNDGKQQHNFTPRLGRDSGEDVAAWLQDLDLEGPLTNARSTMSVFNPRLGRNISPFSPRLGRDAERIFK